MSKGRHRKPTNWRFKYMTGLFVVALGVIAACAAGAPSPAQSQEPVKPNDWKPMSVPGLEYACDPVLGVIVRHQWSQNGTGLGQENWTLSVTSYTQLSVNQRQQLCEVNR